ncbi:MAG: DUF285 domain-containing protein, partial [Lachnospiraceae bacterium]|nr:DUF285 domain-containing protein [Lachnospiraceae bacterium]
WVLEDAQTVYMPGEKPNLDGIWLHCYLGGVSKILTKNYRTNADEMDMSTPGVKKLKVWYEDASGEVDLFVMEPFQDDDIAHKRYDSFAYRIDKNGKLTMMGSTPRDKSTDWRRSQDVLDSIKTAKVVIRGADNFSELLYGCHNLEHVDFSETETRYVENFSLMFYECYKLKSVDLSGFDTRNARSMSFMFGACKSLKHVDLSGFRTENVHLMSRMFYKCEALEHIDLSSFDTRNVNSMSEMFYECRSLTSVNLDSLDTRNVENLPNMFHCCTKLKKLNLANFDLGSATDADSLVGDCKELEELWTPRNVKVAASLGGTWYDDKDNAYTEFPRNRSDSVHLSKQRKTQEQEPEESSTGEESSSGEERSDPAESSSSEESSSNKESSPNEESSPNKESSPNEESASGEGSSDAEESSSGAESSDIAESSSVEESSDVEESSSVEESSDVEESSSVEESSEIEESSSIEESSDSAEGSTSEESSEAEESSSSAESSVPAESSSAEESNDPAESSPNEESSTVEESSSIKESSAAEESESVEESMSSDDHTSSEEASSSEETSSIEESPSDEESASGEESGSEAESSPYTDKERIDLQKAGGKISAIKTKTYDGLAYTPSVKVTVTEGSSRRTLTEGTDYSVIYQQNTDAGQGTAIVRGNGLYKGTLQTTFEITPKSIKKLKIITGSMTTDSQSELPVYVYDGTKPLENGKDYQLTFAGDLTAKASKTAKVTVTAAGNYEGSSTVKLTVYEEDASHIINPEHVTLQAESVPYTGKAYKPALTVKIDGTALRANKDYKVQYQNNKNAGTAYVVVTGKGAYKGKAVKTFEITARSKTEASLTISKISDKTYNGKYQKPSVTVRCGKKKLVKNKDYIITYERNLHASANNQKAQVTITGIGNYEGVVETAEFIIKPQKISKAAVKGTHENLTLTYGSNKLKEGVHYTVTSDASGARSGGKKMNIKIKGLGDFAGSEMTKSVKVQ